MSQGRKPRRRGHFSLGFSAFCGHRHVADIAQYVVTRHVTCKSCTKSLFFSRSRYCHKSFLTAKPLHITKYFGAGGCNGHQNDIKYSSRYGSSEYVLVGGYDYVFSICVPHRRQARVWVKSSLADFPTWCPPRSEIGTREPPKPLRCTAIYSHSSNSKSTTVCMKWGSRQLQKGHFEWGAFWRGGGSRIS